MEVELRMDAVVGRETVQIVGFIIVCGLWNVKCGCIFNANLRVYWQIILY